MFSVKHIYCYVPRWTYTSEVYIQLCFAPRDSISSTSQEGRFSLVTRQRCNATMIRGVYLCGRRVTTSSCWWTTWPSASWSFTSAATWSTRCVQLLVMPRRGPPAPATRPPSWPPSTRRKFSRTRPFWPPPSLAVVPSRPLCECRWRAAARLVERVWGGRRRETLLSFF